MRQFYRLCTACLLMLALGSPASAQDIRTDLSEGFESWGLFWTWNPPPFSTPVTTNEWQIDIATSSGESPHSGARAVWLYHMNFFIGAPADGYVRTPFLTNGVGTVSFWYRTLEGTSSDFILQSSTNGSSWTTLDTVNSITTTTWLQYTNNLQIYESIYLRVVEQNNHSSTRRLGIDDFETTLPSAKLEFSNARSVPAPAIVNSPIDLAVDIADFSYVSNINVTAFYSVDGAPTQSLSMVNTTGDVWVTSATIANVSEPVHVDWRVLATFSGPGPIAPTNYPGSGQPDHRFVVKRPPLNSIYTNMMIIDSVATNMVLTDDSFWLGVISPPAPLSTPSFRFQAGAFTWGDLDPSGNTLPVFGQTDLTAPAMSIAGSVTGHVAFMFDENTFAYTIEPAEFINFDEFGDAQTNYGNFGSAEGWTITDGRVTSISESGKAYSDRTLVLNAATPAASIRSPYLPGGAGVVGLWYRTLSDDGTPSSIVSIEASTDGVSDWFTLITATNVQNDEYHYLDVSLQDLSAHYIRVIGDQAGMSPIMVDEVVITDVGSGVLFSNLVQNPTATISTPSILDDVFVNIDILPVTGTSNITATLWYRSGTNGIWDPGVMSVTGNTYYGMIPRSQIGEMQYYIQADYDGFRSQPAFFPNAGPQLPVAYTNVDAPQFIQTFETWPMFASPPLSIGGWDFTGSSGVIFPDFVLPAYNGTISAYFGNTTNSMITSPLYNDGIGAVTYGARLNDINDPSVSWSVEYKRPADAGWTVVAVHTNTSSTWAYYEDLISIAEPVQVRFRKLGAHINASVLGIDDIYVSYPSAEVRFSNVLTLPGYPSERTPVNIVADIASAFSLTPAINIQADYYYRIAGAPTFEGPFPMDRSGTIFSSANPIPMIAYPERVEYYLVAYFNGYHITPGTDRSPMFFPEGGASDPAYYDIRLHASTHDAITIEGDTSTNNMVLIDDNLWQATFDPTQSNAFSFRVSGVGQFTGTNLLQTTNVWGDNGQWNFNGPLQGFASFGESNIIVNINTNFAGQYVFRFNEITGEYSILHSYFQDFDEWLMSADFFTSGSKSKDNVTWFENYDTDWPLSDTTSASTVTFDEAGWTNYTFTSIFTNFLWETRWSRAVGTTNIRQELSPTNGLGHIHPHSSTLLAGTGQYSFKYRAVGEQMPTLWRNVRQWEDFSTTFTFGAMEIGGDYLNGLPAWQGFYFRRVNATNFYHFRMEPVTESLMRMRLDRITNGVWTRLGTVTNSATLDEYVNYSVDADTTSTNIQITIRRGPFNDLIFDVADTLADGITNSGQIGWGGHEVALRLDDWVLTSAEPGPSGGDLTETFNGTNPSLGVNYAHSSSTWFKRGITNGAPAGEWFCYRKPFRDTPPELDVKQTDIGKMNQPSFYTTLDTLVIDNIAYQTYSTNMNQAETTYMFIEAGAGGTEEVRVDDLAQTGWNSVSITTNGWQVINGIIADDSRQLTSTPVFVELRPSRTDTPTNQFVRSQLVTGVGAIGWRYRSSGGNGAISLEYAVGAASNTWNVLTNYTGITDAWLPRSYQANLAGNHYIRIRNVSTGDVAILIDEFRVNDFQSSDTNTWDGYNIRISGLQTNTVFRGIGSSGYLNHDPVLETAGGPYSNDFPHVRSPLLFRGLGEIAFWGRNIDVATVTNAIVVIESAPSDSGPWTITRTNLVFRPEYQYYRIPLYDRDAEYVRISNEFTNQTDRVAIDNISILEPFAADVTVTNMVTLPQVPLFDDSVFLECTLTRLQLAPSNINVTAYWRSGNVPWGVGNWSNQNATAMILVSSNTTIQPFTYTYRTTVPIPPHSIDTYIQYYFSVSFDGAFSDFTSPKLQDRFSLPSWYEPANFNKELVGIEWLYKDYTTPYYVVFSCPPGTVWMNELNYAGTLWEDSFGTTEYIELMGPAGTHVRNWKVRYLSDPLDQSVVVGDYTITNVVCLPDDTNGYGFVVLADAALGTNVDIVLTNGSPGIGPTDKQLPNPGAIIIERSMGAHEYRYAYGTGGAAFSNTLYIGEDGPVSFSDEVLGLEGFGSNYNDLSWMIASNAGTPHAMNALQTMIELTNGADACTLMPTVQIVDFWVDTNIWIVCTGTNGWTPTPWYTTNLGSPWQEVTIYNTSVSGNQHTMWFDPITSNGPSYYKVITTGN